MIDIYNKPLEYRMYCLVLRQLSSINKGIQMTHCCLEYAQKYYNEPDYQKYVTTDKTVIMLDGGTSPEMDEIYQMLKVNNIKFAAFKEPDLNNLTTSICFLVDDRIWNRNDYIQEAIDSGEVSFSTDPFETDWCTGGINNIMLYQIIKNKRLSL